MTQLILPTVHNTDREFCYKKELAAIWQQQTYFAVWRAALVTAALAYINGH